MLKCVLIYFVIISIITAVVTFYDKKASKYLTKHRVRESTLFVLALLGGGVAEYFVMKTIRHKTKHDKFMKGLPLIIVLHIVIIIVCVVLYYRW